MGGKLREFLNEVEKTDAICSNKRAIRATQCSDNCRSTVNDTLNCCVVIKSSKRAFNYRLERNSDVLRGQFHLHLFAGEVPVREDTCLGPSPLWRRVASSFPGRLYLPSVSAGSSFPAGWTAKERPTISSRWVSNRGLRHSRQAL